MQVTVIYPQGHSNTSEWLKSGWHCPNCGKQEVWVEQGNGDYYLGPQHACSSCGSQFNLNLSGVRSETDQQVLEQIRK